MKYLFHTPQKAAKYNFQFVSNSLKLISISHFRPQLPPGQPSLLPVINKGESEISKI